MNTPFLVGRHLYLRSLLESDALGNYPRWFNDREVCQGNSHHVLPYTPEAASEYIRQTARSRDELVLAIVLVEGDIHIGNIALQRIHPINRSAELSIVIGEKSAWGKGCGLEAAQLLCSHGFRAMNLHRIGCGTFEDNAGMRGLARRLGMMEEGRRREAAFKEGRYVDVVEFGVLKDAFEQATSTGKLNGGG